MPDYGVPGIGAALWLRQFFSGRVFETATILLIFFASRRRAGKPLSTFSKNAHELPMFLAALVKQGFVKVGQSIHMIDPAYRRVFFALRRQKPGSAAI